MTMQDLLRLFKTVLNSNSIKEEHFCSTELVEQKIYRISDEIVSRTEEFIELEEKVILSMGIRLKAERFLIDKINDSVFVSGITGNQTAKLTNKYKKLYSSEYETIELISIVNLMTPENIHLNSFMYEPILDMSVLHLKSLYTDVSVL